MNYHLYVLIMVLSVTLQIVSVNIIVGHDSYPLP